MPKPEFYVGEALIGESPNLAHIDLIIGSKDGPVGISFANALSTPSKGHGGLLSTIRPNLISRPYTIIVPKVTVADLEGANKIYIASPAFMMIYPQQTNVRIYYSNTAVDYLGTILTAIGIGIVILSSFKFFIKPKF